MTKNANVTLSIN